MGKGMQAPLGSQGPQFDRCFEKMSTASKSIPCTYHQQNLSITARGVKPKPEEETNTYISRIIGHQDSSNIVCMPDKLAWTRGVGINVQKVRFLTDLSFFLNGDPTFE